MRTEFLVAGLLLWAAPDFSRSQTAHHGLRVPPGFEVAEFADSKLANDIYCLTIDPKGRVIVSGRGYVRILIDDNDDGKADRAVEFADHPKDGAMGLCWEGDSLFVTGDGGLRRLTDRDGDDKADGPAALIRALKTGGEHAAHAIQRGPDGWLYVLCGNMTGIDARYATTARSPIRDPVAGCVLRFAPDFKECEIVAHGLRNAYAMDFNLDGEWFTYDSDNERCVSLPWYEPTRFYQVRAGGHCGWLSPQRATFWRMPSYFPDVVAPVATLGRGSPTGVVCYRHAQFPKEYRGGFFLAEWTFGKIWFAALERQGARYASRPKVFLEAIGDNGFAPTALAVHPTTGDLFVSIGGRGTRGAVYRVRYPKGLTADLKAEAAKLTVHPTQKPVGSQKQEPDRAKSPTTPPESASALTSIRALQRAVGDIGAARARGTVWEGYTARDAIGSLWKKPLPPSTGPLPKEADRELLRLLAMVGGEAPAALPKRWTASSDPIDNIHELIVWARCSHGNRETKRVAAALLDLDRKVTQRRLNRDSNWPLRIAELYAGLAEKDPKLHSAMVAHAEFGRPDHALFAQAAGFDRARAAALFLERIRADASYAVNTAVLQLLDALPADQVNPIVRPLWGKAGQDAGVVALLARRPEAQDRDKFVRALSAPHAAVVARSLHALEDLHAAADGHEAIGLLRAWKQLPDQQKELKARLRRRIIDITMSPNDSDAPAWTAAIAKRFPDLAPRLTNPDGVDVAAWEKRLARLDFAQGDAERGRAVFVKANCAACHSSASALGPDLKGVTKRFSRPDLFAAIVQPSKDVPVRYQTTQVETRDGRIHQGLVIYDAVDSLILQTAATATIRLNGADVAARQTVPRSLMPSGLLEPLTDGEIVDLYWHLQR